MKRSVPRLAASASYRCAHWVKPRRGCNPPTTTLRGRWALTDSEPRWKCSSTARRQKADGLAAAVFNGTLADWKPYSFSWQYGVENNPGSQGYHGLKGRVDNNFLILDKGRNMLFRTQFYAPETDFYALITGNVTPEGIYIDGENIRSEDIVSREGPNGQRETRYTVNLRKGWHSLLLVFTNTTDQPLRQEPYDLLDRAHAQYGGDPAAR